MDFDLSFFDPPKELNISRCQQSQHETCANCESRGQWTRRCGNCMCVYYCTESCQRRHWRTDHKTMCRHIKKYNIDLTNALRDVEEDPSDDDADGDAPPGLPPHTPPAAVYRFGERKKATMALRLSPQRDDGGAAKAHLPKLLSPHHMRASVHAHPGARFDVNDFVDGELSAAPVLAMRDARAARTNAHTNMGFPSLQPGPASHSPSRRKIQKTEELPSLFPMRRNSLKGSQESPSRDNLSKLYRHQHGTAGAEATSGSIGNRGNRPYRYRGRGVDIKLTHAATAQKIHAMMLANSKAGDLGDSSAHKGGARLNRARHRRR